MGKLLNYLGLLAILLFFIFIFWAGYKAVQFVDREAAIAAAAEQQDGSTSEAIQNIFRPENDTLTQVVEGAIDSLTGEVGYEEVEGETMVEEETAEEDEEDVYDQPAEEVLSPPEEIDEGNEPPPTNTYANPDGTYLVVAGSFKEVTNAQNALNTLVDLGYAAEIIQLSRTGLSTLCAGRYATQSEAQKAVKELKDTHKIDAYIHKKRTEN